MDQLLEKLLESVPKARLLRLFIQNPHETFDLEEVAVKTGVKMPLIKRELGKLLKLGLVIERKVMVRQEPRNPLTKSKRLKSPPVKKILRYHLNQEFWLLTELRNLVIKSSVTSRKALLSKIRKLGNIKLAIIAGNLINNDQSRTDLLLVGDDVKRGGMERFLAELESEIGKSIHYTLMNQDEFKYRMNMFDRFLRDIFEAPHEKIINRLNM